MSELHKTEALVLRKLDFGDSSRIIHFFSEEFGKLTAILKGARSPKSKYGLLLDTYNYVQIVLYKKETRDIQLIKEVDLLKYFGQINDDLEKMKYASGIVELLLNLTVENEAHKKLFRGSIKAIELINNEKNNSMLIFAKYMLFFIKEIGYAIQVEKCSSCRRKIGSNERIYFNMESGLICTECKAEKLVHLEINKELFNLLICLSTKNVDIIYNRKTLHEVIKLIEKFLKYNLHEFRGFKSLELF
jgi:DNA repair protein RecO (recombination protein O)